MFAKRYKNTTAIFLSLTSVLGLSACGLDRPEWLGGEEKRPAENVYIGSKRVPVLNPQPNMNPPQNLQRMAPPPPPPPAKVMAPPPAAKIMPEKLDEAAGINTPMMPRKTFQTEDPNLSETVDIAPLPPAPESVAKLPVEVVPEPTPEPIVEISSEVAPEPAPLEITTENVSPPPEEPAAAATAEEKLSWFSLMFGAEESGSEPARDVSNEPYPLLSTVPEMPQEFKDLKAQQETQMETLETDHKQAQEQKNTLFTEPEQIPAPPPAPASKPLFKPIETSQPAPAPMPAPVPAAPEEPTLLGHVTRDEKTNQPVLKSTPQVDAVQKTEEELQAVAPTTADNTAPTAKKKEPIRVLIQDPYAN